MISDETLDRINATRREMERLIEENDKLDKQKKRALAVIKKCNDTIEAERACLPIIRAEMRSNQESYSELSAELNELLKRK